MKVFKRILSILLLLVAILVLSFAIALLIDRQQTRYLLVDNFENNNLDSYLITNVHVIPMTSDTVLVNHMVLIRNGRIETVDSAIEVADVQVVDGANRYLTPGLVDMHVHVWDKYELGLYLASGVTTIRNVWGMPMHLRMKKQINSDQLIAPMFYTTSPKLTGPEFIGSDNLQIMDADEGVEKVKSYKERGYDFIKTYYGLTQVIFDAILVQSVLSDMDIVSHPSPKVPYTYHLNPQIATIEHAEDIVQQPLNYKLDTSELVNVVRAFSEASHTSFCPTLTAYYNIYNMLVEDDILSSPAVEYMNPSIKRVDSKAQFERWQTAKQEDPEVVGHTLAQHAFHLYAIKLLHDAGVNIVCGTDAGIGVTVPGMSIHEELDFYRQAGLSNYEVLRTATINVSLTHSQLEEIGTIEPDKLANFILSRENPLENISALQTPDMVFVKGRMLDRAILDRFKGKASGRKNSIATMLRYLENWVIEN